MGIYIKGMEMPKNCFVCPLFDDVYTVVDGDDNYSCTLGVSLDYYQASGKTEKDCPLIPVPPHGRLGDLDELHKEAVRRSEKAGTHDIWYNCADRVICALDIKNAPTIIPASEEEIK